MGTRLAGLCHVNNYIIAQVNPFSSTCDDSTSGIGNRLSKLLFSEILLFLELLNHTGLLPRGIASLMITNSTTSIFPISKEDLRIKLICKIPWTELVPLMRSFPFMASFDVNYSDHYPLAIMKGEQVVWREIGKLKIRMRIEQFIETLINELSSKSSIAASPLDYFIRRKRSTSKSLARQEKTKSMY